MADVETPMVPIGLFALKNFTSMSRTCDTWSKIGANKNSSISGVHVLTSTYIDCVRGSCS